MTREDLERWEDELKPLVPLERASRFARENALAFNAETDDVRAALLEPARRMLEKGSDVEHLVPCLDRTVAELAFWRRVLLNVHRDGLRAAERPCDYLVRYLLSSGGGRPATSRAPSSRSLAPEQHRPVTPPLP